MAAKKRPKVEFSEPSKAELKFIAKRLRYMNPENIAKDFPSERERAAIAAVFNWLAYSSVCAWKLKNAWQYSTVYRSSSVRRDLPHDAVVLNTDILERARKVLLHTTRPKKAPK